MTPANIIIVMGVSASGKTSVGQSIARRLHLQFLDGDDYHPAANIAKMAAGIPLDDDDRWPWLHALARALVEAAGQKDAAVGACSALKRAYRDYLTAEARQPILFVHLDGTPALVAERAASRTHRYMPPSLLDSQFATLERPDPATENVLVVPVGDSVEKITRTTLKALDHLKTFKRWQ